jgi:hypothetical protein
MEGEAEVNGENLAEFNLVHHKFHMTFRVIEPWPSRQEVSEIIPRP